MACTARHGREKKKGEKICQRKQDGAHARHNTSTNTSVKRKSSTGAFLTESLVGRTKKRVASDALFIARQTQLGKEWTESIFSVVRVLWRDTRSSLRLVWPLPMRTDQPYE